MLEPIALTIFIISFFGMGFLFVLKTPLLKTLAPQKGELGLRLGARERIKKILNAVYRAPAHIRWNLFFQKALSMIKVLALKTENKSNSLLIRIRKESQQKKEQELDNSDYWQEVGALGKKKRRKNKKI